MRDPASHGNTPSASGHTTCTAAATAPYLEELLGFQNAQRLPQGIAGNLKLGNEFRLAGELLVGRQLAAENPVSQVSGQEMRRLLRRAAGYRTPCGVMGRRDCGHRCRANRTELHLVNYL